MNATVRRRLLLGWAWLWSALLTVLFAGVTALTLGVWAAEPAAAVTTPVTDLAFACLGGAIAAGIASQIVRAASALGLIQALTGSLLLAAAGAAGARMEPLVGGLVFAGIVVVTWALRRHALATTQPVDLPLGTVGLIGLGLAIPVAAHGVLLARASGPSCFLGRCAEGDRYAELAAAAVLFGVLAALAATRIRGWQLPLWTAVTGGVSVGAASVALPDVPASLGRLGGALALLWAVLLIVLGYRRGTASPLRKESP